MKDRIYEKLKEIEENSEIIKKSLPSSEKKIQKAWPDKRRDVQET